jgi:hypothetical protein
MKLLFSSLVAVLSLVGTAHASNVPFTPECRLDYKVSTLNVVVGIGGGKGTITCENRGKVTTAKVDIAILNANAYGFFSETGTVYAAGVGGNADAMLGLLLRAQASAALGHHGRAYSGGGMVQVNSRPNAQVYVSVAKSSGLGGAFGWGAWAFAAAEDNDSDAYQGIVPGASY